jgi:hypothetical protein
MEIVGSNAPLAPGSYPSSPKPYRKHRATKPELLTRDKIDGRGNAEVVPAHVPLQGRFKYDPACLQSEWTST